MTLLLTAPDHDAVRTTTRHRPEGVAMLIHEALARSRQREAERAARQYRRARLVTAGRRWDRLAAWAARRARAQRSRVSTS